MSFRTRYGMSLACVLVAFAVLALACASSTKLAPVMPGTFPLGLPGVPAGFADKIYCATPSVSSTCANSRSGELTCQDILREEAANLLYESQEEDVTRVKNRLRAIVNLEDDREYLDEMTIGTKFKSTSRRLESNVFKTNDGSTRSMRVCVSNEQFRFDLLLKMEELATRDGRQTVASAIRDEMKARYPDRVADPKQVTEDERAILEHFNDLYKEAYDDAMKAR